MNQFLKNLSAIFLSSIITGALAGMTSITYIQTSMTYLQKDIASIKEEIDKNNEKTEKNTCDIVWLKAQADNKR